MGIERKKVINEWKSSSEQKEQQLNVMRNRINTLRELKNTSELSEIETKEFSTLVQEIQIWESSPNHPQYEKCISTLIETLDKRKPVEFLVKCDTLKYNPFFVISKIDQLIPESVLDEDYKKMRDEIINFVHNSTGFSNPSDLKKALGRWFAWGNLDGEKYEETYMFFVLKDNACQTYRKRLKYVYMNLLDPIKKKEDAEHYLGILDTETMNEKCFDGATETLDKLETVIPGSEELTLHQRVVMTCSSRLKEILDKFSIDKKYGERRQEEVEYKLFVELACKNHFSLPVQIEEMLYSSCNLIQIKELESIIRDAVGILEMELPQIIYEKIKPGAKSGKAAGHDIYFEDLIQWMEYHPKYCNELDCGSFFEFPEEGKQIPTFNSTEPILLDLLEDCQLIQRKKIVEQKIEENF